MKITLYATSENGDGNVSEIGQYDDWDDIEIRVRMFAPDVVITFEVEEDKEKEPKQCPPTL